MWYNMKYLHWTTYRKHDVYYPTFIIKKKKKKKNNLW